MLEGIKFTRCETAQIIFGNDVNGMAKIVDSTKPKALKIMSASYLIWLKEVVFKPSNEEIEHGRKLKDALRNNGLSGDVINPEKSL